MKHIPLVAALAAAHLAPAVLSAQEIVIGAGYARFSASEGQDAALLSLDYNLRPFHTYGQFGIGWGGAVGIDTRGDAFLGLGLVMTQGMGENWFLNFSVKPGVYLHGSRNTDLGNSFEIRTLLGIGYHLDGTNSVALAVSHKSNADTGRNNPGVNTISLRWHHSF